MGKRTMCCRGKFPNQHLTTKHCEKMKSNSFCCSKFLFAWYCIVKCIWGQLILFLSNLMKKKRFAFPFFCLSYHQKHQSSLVVVAGDGVFGDYAIGSQRLFLLLAAQLIFPKGHRVVFEAIIYFIAACNQSVWLTVTLLLIKRVPVYPVD